MNANLIRRRFAPIAATVTLIAAGIPALLAPAAGAHSPQPHPHAGRPPERVAYVHRTLVDDSSVPQRTGAL